MKIYELIKQVNNKVSLKDSDLMLIKKYYLSMYRAYMVQMYDKGYISDPTVFNRKEIFGNIIDFGITSSMTNVSGKLELSEERVGYALAKNKDNQDVCDFLRLLKQEVKYWGISNNIDGFYDFYGYNDKVKEKVSQNIYQAASRIQCKGSYKIDEGILRCIYGFKNTFDFVSMDGLIYERALEELGLSNDTDKALFIEGLTKDEEIEYSRLILNGLVTLDGKYADVLETWLKANKWSDNKYTAKREGLYNWVLYIKSNLAIEMQSKLLNDLLDSGNQVVSMDSNGFYVMKPENVIDMPIGVFAVANTGDEDIVLPDINKVEGYTGEAVSVEYLMNEGIAFVGSPIELYYDSKTKGLFVDIEQTELAWLESWFKRNNANLTFEGESSYHEGVLDNGTLEDKLYKLIAESEIDSSNLIRKLDVEGVTLKSLNVAKKSLMKVL